MGTKSRENGNTRSGVSFGCFYYNINILQNKYKKDTLKPPAVIFGLLMLVSVRVIGWGGEEMPQPLRLLHLHSEYLALLNRVSSTLY